MAHSSSTAAIDLRLPSTGNLGQGGPSRDSQHPRYGTLDILLACIKTRPSGNGPPSTLIHTLDDDSLLNVFSLCRPVILDESETNDMQILGGGKWNRERWWYGLVQVCRRWRYLTLESAFHLNLCLVCTHGTPVADMLAHFPPLPLVIDHFGPNRDITAEDKEGIILALQHRDRVRRIRLEMPAPILQMLFDSLDGEFPILEYLYANPQRYVWRTVEPSTSLNLPEAFRAPHLRHLLLMTFTLPIESPVLLTVMGSLVTLSLNLIPPSAYFHPNTLLRRLSLMPQLEILGITFASYYPSRDVERQLLRTPIMTHVTLPNLRWLGFQGASAYLEALLPWVTVPLLEKFQVLFFNQLTYSIPHLQQFMSTAGNLRLKNATLTFLEDYLELMIYPHKGAKVYTLTMFLGGRHLDWQVASAAQVCFTLGTVLSTVEHLTLEYGRYRISSEWNNEADRTQWRELFGSFGNVRTLHVKNHKLVKQLFRALQPGEGESPTELLPELRELSYPARGALHNPFALFIDARQKAGRPVAVVHALFEGHIIRRMF